MPCRTLLWEAAVGLSDQTLGFFLSLDTAQWDKSVKKVGTDYKRFVDALDKATTKVSDRPQKAINALAGALSNLSTSVASAQKIVSTLDRGLSRGRPVKIPVQFIVQGQGANAFKQAIADALGQALSGTRLRLNPVVPSKPAAGFRPGTSRMTYKGMPTPAAYEAGFVTAQGTPRPVRRRPSGGRVGGAAGSPARIPHRYGGPDEGVDQVPVLASRGEYIMSEAAISDLIEHTVRTMAMVRWAGVSPIVATGAMRLRGEKGVSRALRAHMGAQAELEELYQRRDLGEKVSTAQIQALHKQIEETYEQIEETVKLLKDPTTARAGKLMLEHLNGEMAALHANAELSGTIFDPRHWYALSRHAGPVVRTLAGWFAHSPYGRTILGVGAMGYGAFSAYRRMGGLASAMTAHDMTANVLRYQPGMSREGALNVGVGAMMRSNELITRAELAQGLGAGIQSGLANLGGSAEYLAYAQKGFGLDPGVGAEFIGDVMNRFGRSLSTATALLGQFAGEARRSRVSINQLGQVAMEAADAATEADYRRGTAGFRIGAGVTAFGAATRFFGGGQAGARLAAPLSDIMTRLQQGDVSAAGPGAALFGTAATRALTGKANATDLLKNINYGLLRNLVGQPPIVIQAMARTLGLPYQTLAAMVGRVGAGQTITPADLAAAPEVSAKDAARRTTVALQRFRNLAGAGVDELTGVAPDAAINLGYGTGLIGEGLGLARDLAMTYGGLRMAGLRLPGVGRALRAPFRAIGRGVGSLVTRAGVALPIVPSATTLGSFAGMGVGALAGGGAAGLGALAGGIALPLSAGAVTAYATQRSLSSFREGQKRRLGLEGTSALDALAEDTSGLMGWMKDLGGLFNTNYSTDLASAKTEVIGNVRQAALEALRIKAVAQQVDPEVFIRENIEDVNRQVAEAKAALAGVTDIQDVGAIAGGISQRMKDELLSQVGDTNDILIETNNILRRIERNSRGE